MILKNLCPFFKKINVTNFDQNLKGNESSNNNEIIVKPYKRRFWMLGLFSTLSMLAGMLFPQFVSIANINMCFYGVSFEALSWTSLIFMVVYIFLVFPVSWMMTKTGLRTAVTMGAMCNTIALAVQFLSLTPDAFIYVIASSFFASLSNVLVLAVPPCLAAIWFPSTEVSRACAMGVFGNQLGVALGFVIPPFLTSKNCSDPDGIADGKKIYAIIFTSINTAILLIIIFTFQNEPKHPPSLEQAKKKDTEESYMRSALTMVMNMQFMLVFLMYGFTVGTYFAIATILNNLMMPYFPNEEIAIGWMGLLVIVTGLVGSVIAGYILDYTHRFKETTVIICLMSFISCVLFTCLLPLKMLWLQFLTISVLGFFLTSFLPVGFEYGIEVTYPESEITSSGLLNASTMLFGIIITEASSFSLKISPTYANITLCVALLIGTALSCVLTKNYKRSRKNEIISCTSLKINKDLDQFSNK